MQQSIRPRKRGRKHRERVFSVEFFQEFQILDFSFDFDFARDVSPHGSEFAVYERIQMLGGRYDRHVGGFRFFFFEFGYLRIFEFYSVHFGTKVQEECFLEMCDFVPQFLVFFASFVELFHEPVQTFVHCHVITNR